MVRLAFFLFGLFILNFPQPLRAQLHLQQIGHLSYPGLSLAGCVHYVDGSGGEWALVGTSAGLSIVDLRNPAQPVERFTVPGLPNNWREVRTWEGFAYVGSEADGSGITIVDLRQLPASVNWKVWFGDAAHDSLVRRSHTVQTRDGYLYIFGGGNFTDGATIASLADPWNPVIVGKYTANYVHDGFIRGDTLWTSEIYKGLFAVVDISDKTSPKLLATQPTPGAFNHNAELSDDSAVLFTTDEKANTPVGAFDVTDLDNITLIDRYFPSRKPNAMVHNVRVKGDFMVNPSYGGQLTIVDISRPDNLIETGWALLGTSLVWDADPYLPSGIVFATAKNEGLFVFQPTYQHAAWLEGLVLDSLTGKPLFNAKVFVLNTPNADTTNLAGRYKTGAALPGPYSVQVVKPGYHTRTIPDVSLQTNQVSTLTVKLLPEITWTGPSVRVSPSPFTDRLIVEFAPDSLSIYTETTARLFDMAGRLLREQQFIGGLTVLEELGDLPAGAYLLVLQSAAGKRRTFRVVK